MSNTFGKRDTMPLTWMGRVPVYASTILVAVFVAGMMATVLLASARVSIQPFAFDAQDFWKKAYLWQPFTFPLIDFPSFFYAFGLCFLYWFGVGIETHLGRRVLLRLLLLLCIVPALTASAWWLADRPLRMPLSGSSDIAIGLFIAYATLYPNVEVWNWIPMKWLAFAGIVLNALMFFPGREWDRLSVFLSACAAAHIYTRYEQGHWVFPSFRWSHRKPAFRVVPREDAPRRSMPREEMLEEEIDTEVDELLEKIARSGLSSLTSKERTQLEKAREALLKKERK